MLQIYTVGSLNSPITVYWYIGPRASRSLELYVTFITNTANLWLRFFKNRST